MNSLMNIALASSVAAMMIAAPIMAEETRMVLDQRGVEVEVPKNVERMVVFAGPLPSVVFAIEGTTKSIVGAAPWSVRTAENGMMATMSPEILDAKTDFLVGSAGVNLEELMQLEPDVLIAWLDEPEALIAMEKAGLSVIAVDVMGKGQSQKHFEEWLRILGQIYDKEDRANQLLALQHQTIAEMETLIDPIAMEDRPRVMMVSGFGKGLVKTRGGENDHHYFWLSRSGGQSVTKALHAGTQQVNVEQVLEWNPEVIYLASWTKVSPQDLYDNNVEGMDWSQVSAVKNHRVYKVPLGVYAWSPPNAERALLLKWAAKRNYPKRFDGIDMSKLVTDFYKEFFGYDLNEAETKKILQFELNGVL